MTKPKSPRPLNSIRDHAGRRARLLDHFLRLTEGISARRLNATLVASIVACSLLLSLSLAVVLEPMLGPYPQANFYRIVVVISLIVSLIIAVPAVLYADTIMRRLNGAQRKLNDALTQATLASRAKSEFLANISHEIRTPMNGVLGMVQVLDATELTQSQRENLRLIRVSGDMLMSLIDDILDLSRIEAGRMDLQPAPHALIKSLEDTVALFQARATENGTALTFAAAPGTPERLLYDSVRVRQCLGNLVSNAVKFTTGGTIAVTLSTTLLDDGQTEVVLTVTDTGIGIDPLAQKRLFEAFTQAEATTVKDYGGTGLGLAISRRLARMMGGDISVTSAPGAGSSFVFRFLAQRVAPAAASQIEAESQKTFARRDLQGISILVVDDSAVNRRVAGGLLTPLGAICHEAAGGLECLAVLAECAVDLVLLDMQMPVMDGAATLQAIRRSGEPWSQVRVVALTANAMGGERERCLQMGMQGYASKPIRLPVLLEEITRALSDTGPDEDGRASAQDR
ncbi:ATP-binding protein [Pseudotabrizicola formosa]|uniref:ATP-binding protein n=1 Tax=Pseudotabrizicola formosa TaxID=2030009 RepID=UPI000CD2007C|nr:ATP-binding protein [Pseudotabrizicola formosa]